MRLRALAVTTALALAATGLTACSSKIGLAAEVDGHGITQKTVDSYLSPAGPDLAALQTTTPPAVRPLIVNYLVQQAISTGVLRRHGGVPSASVLQVKFYPEVAAELSQGQSKGGTAFDQELTTQVVQLGLRSSFEPVLIRSLELSLAAQSKASSSAGYAALVKQISVSVNPRYGAWDVSTGSLSTAANAGLPSFVTIGSDTQASASPTAGQ